MSTFVVSLYNLRFSNSRYPGRFRYPDAGSHFLRGAKFAGSHFLRGAKLQKILHICKYF